MARLLCVVVISLGLTVSACGGESKEEKAQKAVCSARADIKKQVDELKGTTVSSGSLEGVQASLSTIRKDLEQIQRSQKDLEGDRRQEVQQANQAFRTQVASVGREIITSLGSSNGEQQIQAALQGLQAGYRSALAPIDCP